MMSTKTWVGASWAVRTDSNRSGCLPRQIESCQTSKCNAVGMSTWRTKRPRPYLAAGRARGGDGRLQRAARLWAGHAQGAGDQHVGALRFGMGAEGCGWGQGRLGPGGWVKFRRGARKQAPAPNATVAIATPSAAPSARRGGCGAPAARSMTEGQSQRNHAIQHKTRSPDHLDEIKRQRRRVEARVAVGVAVEPKPGKLPVAVGLAHDIYVARRRSDALHARNVHAAACACGCGTRAGVGVGGGGGRAARCGMRAGQH